MTIINLKSVKLVTKTVSKIYALILFLILLLFVTFSLFVSEFYKDKIYPNIQIAGITVGGLTKAEAIEKLAKKTSEIQNLKLVDKEGVYTIPLENIGFNYDIQKTVDLAFNYKRPNSSFRVLETFITSQNSVTTLELQSNLNSGSLKDLLMVTLKDIPIDPVYPKLIYKSGKLEVENGTSGRTINFDQLTTSVYTEIKKGNYVPIKIDVQDINPELTESELLEFQNKGALLIGKKIIVTGPNYFRTELKDIDLLKTLSPQNYYDEEVQILITDIKTKVDKEPENSTFKEENGKVLEFKVSRNGISVKSEELGVNLKNSIEKLAGENKSIEIEVPYTETTPEITTEKVNNLGIKELLGTGYSEFAHSIPSRVHNVGLASSKFNGLLVSPGETFSFNNALGDVSKFTGFKQAYVIKDGKTILGDGGGVCQVSTTLFRALLNSGLQITERAAHSYRVSYYEQNSPAGLDATVYSPSPDLKFINDTPGSILIQTIFNGNEKTLVFELYGTSDGRTATVSTPKTVSQSKPPDDVYVDDPTLENGKIVQMEHKAWGAKIVFNYKVEKNGETIIDKDFVSNYRPWGAVYRRGTAPAI